MQPHIMEQSQQTHWQQANHTYYQYQIWYTHLHKPNVFSMLPETSSTQIQTIFTNEAVTILTTTATNKTIETTNKVWQKADYTFYYGHL
uniref:Uncharacterized protein n=1 Tax=Amphimedon queenslandica TaxID=400682 RepID=A0A1X7V6B3_AMPQE